MMRFLGLVFSCFLGGMFFLLLNYFIGNGFIDDFFGTASVTLMGTLLGLNLVLVVFLVQSMTNLEVQIKKTVFDSSKKEVKHNVYFMLILFVGHVLVLVCKPDCEELSSVACRRWALICNLLNLTVFGLGFYCIFESVRASFEISGKIVPELSGESEKNK